MNSTILFKNKCRIHHQTSISISFSPMCNSQFIDKLIITSFNLKLFFLGINEYQYFKEYDENAKIRMIQSCSEITE